MFEQNKNSAEGTGMENREIPVSKDQTSMFDNMETKPGYIHIAHEENAVGPVEGPMPAESKYSFEKNVESEEKPEGVNKGKVLAALAIVAVAAYVANWVQEPVQLKADVLSGDDVVAEENLMAQADQATETADMPSTSVDVSLFGFEPAVLNVEKDTKVVWTNTSSEQQTLIGSSVNGESFTSPVLESGESFEYAFTSDDDFEYYSTYNPALKASIRVGNGAAVMETTSNTEDTTTQPEDLFGSAPENTTSSENAFENLNDILAQQQALQNQVLETAMESASTNNAVSTETVSTNSETQENAEDLRQAAAEAEELAQTGPEDMLYVLALGMIVYFNRKKLGAIFA
ncbi:MAG: cupredoxin domain-containing protein [Candidatus Altimarinota bacterium]